MTVKERPILMNDTSVSGLLKGIKTHTRRVCKRGPDVATAGVVYRYPYKNSWTWVPDKCPYGQPGDRLWVKETWATTCWNDDCKPSELVTSMGSFYRADSVTYDEEFRGKWRPSIFMPRWASRILLEITDVRVERLQEITPEDCLAEGCPSEPFMDTDGVGTVYKGMKPTYWYQTLWDSINGNKPGRSWDDNPWVWVIVFKVINAPTHMTAEQIHQEALHE